MRKLITLITLSSALIASAATTPKTTNTHYFVGTKFEFGLGNNPSGLEVLTGASFYNFLSVDVAATHYQPKNAVNFNSLSANMTVSLPTKISPYASYTVMQNVGKVEGKRTSGELDGGVNWQFTKTLSVYGEYDSLIQAESAQAFEVGAEHSTGHWAEKVSVNMERVKTQNKTVSLEMLYLF